MFDLEQSIAEWRQQMMAAGIKSPMPLVELESHLREEIDRQIKVGLSEQTAFEISVQQIGRHDDLKTEFAKSNGLPGWFGDNKATRVNRILSVLWFALCTRCFIAILSSPIIGIMILCFPHFWSSFAVVSTALCLTGIFGSVFLFCGAKLGQHIIRFMAGLGFLLGVLEFVTQDGSFGAIPKYWFGILSIFSLITIWLLRSPSVKDPKTATG